MAEISWSDRARNEFDGACLYIGRRSELQARLFAERVESALDRLSRFPLSGRIVPEFDVPQIREVIVQSYRIIYGIQGDVVELITVIHGARRLRPADLGVDVDREA